MWAGLAAWIKAAIKSGSANLISRSAARANQLEAIELRRWRAARGKLVDDGVQRRIDA
jgi:hypothetical protein